VAAGHGCGFLDGEKAVIVPDDARRPQTGHLPHRRLSGLMDCRAVMWRDGALGLRFTDAACHSTRQVRGGIAAKV